MANICSNVLKINGKPEELNKLLDKICIERNPNMFVTGGYRTNHSDMEMFKKYEANPEYKNVRMTEEDGYTVVIFEEKAEYDNFGGALEGVNINIERLIESTELDSLANGNVSLNYSTRWEPLIDIVEKLAKLYPELTFTHYYAEPGHEIYGWAIYENGMQVYTNTPGNSSARLNKWLDHETPEDFKEELGLIDDED